MKSDYLETIKRAYKNAVAILEAIDDENHPDHARYMRNVTTEQMELFREFIKDAKNYGVNLLVSDPN